MDTAILLQKRTKRVKNIVYAHGKCWVLKITPWLCVWDWESVCMGVHMNVFTSYAQNQIQSSDIQGKHSIPTKLHSKLNLIETDNYTHNLEMRRINAWTNNFTLYRWQYVILCVLMGNLLLDYSHLSRENKVISLTWESIRFTQKQKKSV